MISVVHLILIHFSYGSTPPLGYAMPMIITSFVTVAVGKVQHDECLEVGLYAFDSLGL